MTAALLRHGLVLVLAVAAVWTLGVTLNRPVAEQPVVWLATAVLVGVLAAIVARGWLGAVFLVAGMALGVDLLIATQTGSSADALAALKQDGWLYAAMTLASLEAYLIVVLLFTWRRRASG
jgi:hypothetical protein